MADEKKEKKVAEEKEKKQTATEQMEDIKGTEGEGFVVKSKRGKIFKILPCSISELPKLYEKINEYQTKPKNSLDEEATKLIGEILSMGLKERYSEMTPEKCLDIFSLSDFPKILGIMMDLNDFFVGMREITAKGIALQKVVESVK